LLIFPEFPELTPSLTASVDSDGGTISKNTPLPQATLATLEGLPPSPTLAPTMVAEPTQTSLPSGTPIPTPTFAPTQDPYITPISEPTETSRPTPTLAPTQVAPVTPTPINPTPTLAPTDYLGLPGCTQPMEYWMNNPEDWPLEQFQIGDVEYDQTAAIDILYIDPLGDATYFLARQYIASLLNISSPADPTSILGLVAETETWFQAYPLGSDPKKQARKDGLKLADALEVYNLGIVGPGACEEIAPPSPTPTATLTPIGELTPTLAPTELLPTPSPTPTPVDPTPKPTAEAAPEPTSTPLP